MILTGFIAAGCWKPGASFELTAPTQLSSCLDESWKAVSAHKELQNEEIPGVFDQKLVILDVDVSYDSDDIDDEKILFKNCDEINILTVLTEDDYRYERSLKALNKNKNIV